MAVKEELKIIGPEIMKLMPEKKAEDIAAKMGKHKKVIPRMIRGKTGSEKNCMEAAEMALVIIIEEASSTQERAKSLLEDLRLISINAVSAAS